MECVECIEGIEGMECREGIASNEVVDHCGKSASRSHPPSAILTELPLH